MRPPHLVGHHVAIDVHCRSDIAVPHQLLLNSYCTNPTASEA
jgi:hypothetical protein